MKTKNIFKTLAAAMLMPVMLLTTSCSSEDDLLNTESTAKKGYTIPVTVNVTRQGDATATRATYNSDSKKLEFSEGDKLFVSGCYNDGEYNYAGTLDYDAVSGTFSGTITTATKWTGTAEELLSADGGANATLLPAGYGVYGYLSIDEEGTSEAFLDVNPGKAFATSKSAAVEQFSWEYCDSYSDGFTLMPSNSVLNFTINGLEASSDVDVAFSFPNYPDPIVISGNVKTDGSGTAIFAIGIIYANDLKDCTLTVDGNDITLVSESKVVEAGMIYNITRSVAPANPFAGVRAEDIGKVIGADGKIYVDAAAAAAANTTAVAKICYVGSDNGEDAPYNHGLALALSDANGGGTCKWKNAASADASHISQNNPSSFAKESGLQYNETHNNDTYPAFKAAIANNGTAVPTGCSDWFLASGYQLTKMAGAVGGYGNLGLNSSSKYWSSTAYMKVFAWYYDFSNGWKNNLKQDKYLVRACIAF